LPPLSLPRRAAAIAALFRCAADYCCRFSLFSPRAIKRVRHAAVSLPPCRLRDAAAAIFAIILRQRHFRCRLRLRHAIRRHVFIYAAAARCRYAMPFVALVCSDAATRRDAASAATPIFAALTPFSLPR
jgi:hypothetical protein